MAISPKHLIPASYGAAHFAVDATTVSVVMTATHFRDVTPDRAFMFVIVYDVLAFASQFLIGLLTDHLRAPRGVAFAGLLGAFLSAVVLPYHALGAVVLAGLGNALFHVGGGSLSLSVDEGRATAPGVFVGPGALGLAFGLWVGKQGYFPMWPFLVAMVAAFVGLLLVPVPPQLERTERPARRPSGLWDAVLVATLLLFSILVRQFVGMGGFAAVHKTTLVGFSLGAAGVLGKVLGGFLSDRFGWVNVGVGALLVSAPVIAFASDYAGLMIVGMFLFQMTMPVTLAALTFVFPRRPGFVFGIACLALIGGALLTFTRKVTVHSSSAGFLVLILLSALALFVALRRLRPTAPSARVSPAPAATTT